MERLTYRDANGEAWYSDSGTEADRLHFVADMDDILGNDYDLDRLRELVEADREGRCVPVVRCRECRHYKERRTQKYGNLICRCTRMGKYDMDYPVKPDDFCSYGERRTTDAE